MQSTNATLEKQLRYVIRQGVLSEVKLYKSLDKKSPFTRNAVVSMIDSGFFTLDESIALRALLRKDRFRHLNEATVNRIDTKVESIVNSDDVVFNEAIGDFFKKAKEKVSGAVSSAKEKVSGLFDKAKAALEGGWDKLKKIWSNFSGLVKQVCKHVAGGLKKLWDYAQAQGKKTASSLKGAAHKKAQEAHDKNKPAFKRESSHIQSMHAYWKSTVYEKWVEGSEWIEKVIAGEGSPEEVKTSEKQESLGGIDFDFSNARFLKEVYGNFGKRVLKESEGHSHLLELETAIKNPVGKKIVEYAMKLIQFVFTPIAFATKTLAGKSANDYLNAASIVTSKLGGPPAIKYSLIGALFGELLATLGEILAATHLGPAAVGKVFHASLAIFSPHLVAIMGVFQGLLLCYATTVCLLNVIDFFLEGKVSKDLAKA